MRQSTRKNRKNEKMISRNLRLAIVIAITIALLVPHSVVPAKAVNTFQNCDLFVSLGSDSQIAWWRPDKCGIPTTMTLQGTFKAPGITGLAGGGMAFNQPSCALGPGHPCLYATEFSADKVAVFDNTGTFLSTCGTGYNHDPESIFVDTRSSPGAIYVGQADGTRHILKFNLDCTTGSPASFAPATEARGTDWIDLVAPDATDGGLLCDMQYTSESAHVKVFDICSNIQESDLNSVALTGFAAFAHRQVPVDKSVLVADSSSVAHLDSLGSVIKTCDAGTALFALTILPGATEFVTADLLSGLGKTDYFTVPHCDAGNVLPDFTFNSIPIGCTGGARCQVAGLAVFGEVTAAGAAPCDEDDGNGNFNGDHGRGDFNVDDDQCEDGDSNHISSTDLGDGKDFKSTSISTTSFNTLARTVTIIGTGTHGGVPVAFTFVALETGPTTPGWVSFTLSDGYSNAGNLTSGSIILH
jgi:hypothetical protein